MKDILDRVTLLTSDAYELYREFAQGWQREWGLLNMSSIEMPDEQFEERSDGTLTIFVSFPTGGRRFECKIGKWEWNLKK